VCDPLTIAIGGLALSAGSKVASALGDKKRENANREAADEALAFDITDLLARITEEQTAAAQRVEQGSRAARRAASTARVGAGEAGVAGISVDLLLDDIQRQQGEFTSSVEQNLEATERQIGREIRGAGVRRDSRVNAVRAPSAFSTALRIGGSGLDFVGQRLARKSQTKDA